MMQLRKGENLSKYRFGANLSLSSSLWHFINQIVIIYCETKLIYLM
jgi:hypothetical protein